jgi:hypothetical protein
VMEDCLRHYGHLVVSVSTETHYRSVEESLFSAKLGSLTALQELKVHRVGEMVGSVKVSLKLKTSAPDCGD